MKPFQVHFRADYSEGEQYVIYASCIEEARLLVDALVQRYEGPLKDVGFRLVGIEPVRQTSFVEYLGTLAHVRGA